MVSTKYSTTNKTSGWKSGKEKKQGIGISGHLLHAFILTLLPLSASQAALTIENLTAPNFVVDSNVLTPATFAPKSAMIGARFCNTGTTDLTNVYMYTGDYANSMPGVYPKRNSNTFAGVHDHLYHNSAGYYSLTHEGGSQGTADAYRFIPTIAANDCVVQYWLVSYPATTDEEKELVAPGPTRASVTGGSVKPDDDLWLTYDFWASATDSAASVSADSTDNKATMRNEISAMAN